MDDLDFGLPPAVVRMKARRRLADQGRRVREENLRLIHQMLALRTKRPNLDRKVEFTVEPTGAFVQGIPSPAGTWSPLTGNTL